VRYLGCTGHAHEVAAVFGDDVALLGQTLELDIADPAAVFGAMVAFATSDRDAAEREQITRSLEEGAQDWAINNFATGCEVAVMLAERLDLAPDVLEALRFTYERWNGHGYPTGAYGEAIPLAMRIVHLCHDMEAIGRRSSPGRAIAAARDRRDRTYDPALADLFVEHGGTWFERLAGIDPWGAVLEQEPEPRRVLDGDTLEVSLTVVADFVDLKSPFRPGHSRRCAQLAGDAASVLGASNEAVAAVRRAALVHELGMTALPNTILDKAAPLSRAELDRVHLHTLLTEQMLGRSPALATVGPAASGHHEKADGSGYHRGLRSETTDRGARILAATDVYVGLTSDRADRLAFTEDDAATEIGRMCSAGALETETADAVLVAAGQAPASRTPRLPSGLTAREAEVLRLAARGLTTRAIADRLFISPKTADHHIQHVYTKIGVSTRAGAALWAVEHDLVD
jgi:HD-GYP domain-containing protein (c-di-GMP phosphodiesterase class II)